MGTKIKTMTYQQEALPAHMTDSSKLGEEISITGKWKPTKKSSLFGKSAESKQMVKALEEIHTKTKNQSGVLSTEINHAVGEDAVLVHHVFANPQALEDYLTTTAPEQMAALSKVAQPEIHLLRGTNIPNQVKTAVSAKDVPGVFGDFLYGYVKDDYKRPDPTTAIQVTAKWTCKSDDPKLLEELKYWWQRVGTDAFDLEEGLVRFEAYQVPGENALIIHESFADSDELKFHLTKGTAERYKKNLDKIAAPECYYFRGPVSWMIRTYSRFMRLPATYSSQGSHFTKTGGSMSDGIT